MFLAELEEDPELPPPILQRPRRLFLVPPPTSINICLSFPPLKNALRMGDRRVSG